MTNRTLSFHLISQNHTLRRNSPRELFDHVSEFQSHHYLCVYFFLSFKQSESVTFEQFKRNTIKEQQALFDRFGDRDFDRIPKNEINVIRDKVSRYICNGSYEDLKEGAHRSIDNTVEKLLEPELSGNEPDLLLGCFYVNILVKNENTAHILAVLRTKKIENGDEKIILYEVHSQRVYHGGCEDYLQNNKLPKCWMGYPRGGRYRHSQCDKRVYLDFRESPSCCTFWPVVDVISTVAGIAGTGVLVATIFCPPLLVVDVLALGAVGVTSATSAYGMTRGIYEMVDRGTHDQSISPADPEAFRQWINIVLGAGSTLAGCGAFLAKVASLGGVPIAVNTSSLRVAVNVLRYMNIGMSSVGSIVIILDLVIKFLSDNLEPSDLQNFVSLVLLVANIVISTKEARKIIEEFAQQPERTRNAFNMVRNTAVQPVKSLMTNLSWERTLTILTGDVVMEFVRGIGLDRTASAVDRVTNVIQRYRSKSGKLMNVFLEIGRSLYIFFTEVIIEVKEALEKFEKWFARSKNQWRSSTDSPCSYSGTLALEVTDEVNRVVDDMGLTNSKQDDVAYFIGKMANEVANETNCEFGTADYLELCELICDKLRTTWKVEFILQHNVNAAGMSTRANEDEKLRIFRHVFTEFQESAKKKELIDIFCSSPQRQGSEGRKKLFFHKPIFQSVKNSIYYFETPLSNLDQFVHDAACELWKTDELFESTRSFHLGPSESTFLMVDGSRSLIFQYEYNKKRKTIVGIVIMDEERED